MDTGTGKSIARLAGGLVFGSLVLAGGAEAQSQPAGPDKRAFTLFHPTPHALMRPDLSADRPDITESPITVDAGHLQVELSLVDVAFDREAGVQHRTLSAAPVNIKVGLRHNVDLQWVFTPYERQTARGAGLGLRASGVGDDTQLRLKVNLWGNDGPHPRFGDTALGIMPFVKFPTGSGGLSNDRYEAGLIVPFAASLPGEWGLGVMAEIDVTHDAASDTYGADLVHSVTVNHAVPRLPRLGGYLEYVGVAPHGEGAAYQARGSGGFSLALRPTWSIDAGATVGLTRSADDRTLFTGMTVRF